MAAEANLKSTSKQNCPGSLAEYLLPQLAQN